MSFGIGFLLGAMAGATGAVFLMAALRLGAEEDKRRQMASDLLEGVDRDNRSREEWRRAIRGDSNDG